MFGYQAQTETWGRPRDDLVGAGRGRRRPRPRSSRKGRPRSRATPSPRGPRPLRVRFHLHWACVPFLRVPVVGSGDDRPVARAPSAACGFTTLKVRRCEIVVRSVGRAVSRGSPRVPVVSRSTTRYCVREDVGRRRRAVDAPHSRSPRSGDLGATRIDRREAGERVPASSRSSKPITMTSPGTRRPACCSSADRAEREGVVQREDGVKSTPGPGPLIAVLPVGAVPQTLTTSEVAVVGDSRRLQGPR